MSIGDLKKTEEENGYVELVHIVRNDLMCIHEMLKQSIAYLIKADHRLNGTMQSLQALIDKEREKNKHGGIRTGIREDDPQ